MMETPGINSSIFPERRFTLRSVLLVTAALAFTWGLTAHQIRRSDSRLHERYLRTAIPQFLGQLNYALRIYGGRHTFLGRFLGNRNPWPPAIPADDAGQPLYSWRAPLGSSMLTDRSVRIALDQPWNSSRNQAASRFFNPFNVSDSRNESSTQFFGVTGPGTPFDPDAASHFADVPPRAIILMEVADSRTNWMQPGDYDVTQLLAATGRLGDTVKGLLPDRIHVLFADGEVWALSPDTPMDAVKPFLTIPAAKTADRDKDLAPFRVDD